MIVDQTALEDQTEGFQEKAVPNGPERSLEKGVPNRSMIPDWGKKVKAWKGSFRRADPSIGPKSVV